MRLLVALVALFGAAASLGAPGSPAAANGVTVVAKGSCVVAGGVAKNWDVWRTPSSSTDRRRS